MTKISALSDIGTGVASNDVFVLVDASDPTTPNKKVQQQNLLAAGGLLPDGSEATPGLRFLNDTDTGIYSPGANEVAISTNGAGRLFVDASGNVGIGTTSPGCLLELAKAGANGAQIDLKTTDSTAASSRIRGVGSDGFADGEVRFVDNGISFQTGAGGATERARIDSSGRLLVGTSSSVTTYKTEIVDDASLNLALVTGSNSSAANCPFLTIRRSRGSTASPSVVSSGDLTGTIDFRGYSGAASSYVSCAQISAAVDGIPDSGGDTTDMPGRLVFSVTADGSASPTEAMRINNAGELLVGYTSDNGAYKLQVNSQIFATSATIATSDGRYKENVASLNGSLDLVKALRPVSFTWKPQEDITRLDDEGNEVLVREGHNFPEGTQVGFIAQEVQEVLDGKPWLGSVIKENVRPAVKDNDGNELAPEEQFYGIAEGNLIAVLTNALQEAVGRIETLEAEVAALKS